MKIIFAVLMVLTMASLSSAQSRTSADVVFINGDFYLGAFGGAQSDCPLEAAITDRCPVQHVPELKVQAIEMKIQAIAVSAGRITRIGTNDEVQKLKGPKTQVIDLGGHFVMPGFNDAHTHLVSGGFEKLNVDLVGTKSLDDMKQRIAARAKTAAAGEWLVGRGWDHTLWTDQRLPNRSDLDSVTGDHPAIFSRVDGHIAVPTRPPLKLSPSMLRPPIQRVGKLIVTKKANPPASCARPQKT